MLEAVPYQVHTILTEPLLVRHWFKPNGGGIQFAEQPRNWNTITSRPMRFDMICEGEPSSAIDGVDGSCSRRRVAPQ